MTKQIITPGSFNEAYQYGRQIHWVLTNFLKFPGNLIPSENSIVYHQFLKFFAENPGAYTQFKLVLFVAPKIKQEDPRWSNKQLRQPTKNQHHWILISDFWAKFFNQFLAEWGYRKNSDIFVTDFCSVVQNDLVNWIERFHLHFVSENEIEPDLKFWKEFINSQHLGKLSSLLKLEPTFVEFNFKHQTRGDLYKGLNYKPIDPAELYINQVLVPLRQNTIMV